MKISFLFNSSRGAMLRRSLLVFSTVGLLSLSSSLASTDFQAAALATNPSLLSTGIKNLGNTCYMNAQLQCAFHIPLVRKFVIEDTEGEEKKLLSENEMLESTNTKQESDAKRALRELFSEMIVASSQQLPAITPRTFCLRLGIPPMVQQDSQEFWKLLLPALEHESISDLYKGSFEAYITALDGSGRERRREELFLDLSLDIGKSATLLDSIKESFGEPEVLRVAEGNGWRPEKGADKVDAHKGSSLVSGGLPSILQFHLKRFTYDWQTDSMTKVNSRLAFPAVLDLSSLCKAPADDEDMDPTTYELQSIVIHAGKYGMGHYYSYVRPDINNDNWYRFNDHIVEKVSEQEMFEDAFGGEVSTPNSSQKNEGGGIPLLGRFLRSLAAKRGKSHGYGGSTSNAYVVQYVRRSDRSKLYLEKK